MDLKVKIWELLVSNVPTIAYAIALGIGTFVFLTKVLRFTYDAIKDKHAVELTVLKLTHELSEERLRASMEDRIERLFEKHTAEMKAVLTKLDDKLTSQGEILSKLNREVGELKGRKSKGVTLV